MNKNVELEVALERVDNLKEELAHRENSVLDLQRANNLLGDRIGELQSQVLEVETTAIDKHADLVEENRKLKEVIVQQAMSGQQPTTPAVMNPKLAMGMLGSIISQMTKDQEER
jgi:hypothetical protein